MEDSNRTVQNASRKRNAGRVLLDAVAEAILNSILFVYGFIAWSLKWTAATLVLLAVMAGAGLYVFTRAIAGGELVTVPTCVNRSITDAHYLIAQQGLEIGKQTTVFSEQVPEFHVISQRPPAGKVVRAGRKVYLTVSGGLDKVEAPNLVGKSLAAARTAIEQSLFVAGTVARVPYDAPPDTVIAQDPEPQRAVRRGSDINLLVSAGGANRSLMPDLRDRPVQEALQTLASLGVVPVPKKIDRPGAPFDVILDQSPPAGTIIQERQVVEYTIRPSGDVSLPDVRKRVWAKFTVPDGGRTHTVRVEIVDRNGARQTVFPREEDFKDGRPPEYQPGTQIDIPVLFIDEVTVEFYVDNAKARTYYYRGDAEPVINDFSAAGGGNRV